MTVPGLDSDVPPESAPGLAPDIRLIGTIQQLSLARSLSAIAEIVRSAGRRFAGADGATFILREQELCHYFDEDAIRPLWKGQRFAIASCVSGMAMQEKRAIAITDIYKDARVPIALYEPTFVRSLLMTPVRSLDPIGAIGIYWAEAHVPTVEEIGLLQALADSTAIAMENVALQASLEQKVRELEKANQAKDEFLATLSHELRSPMTSISGWIEILLDEAAPLDEAERRVGLDTIRRNADLQMRLIADLLDSSQIVLGKLNVHTTACDLRDLVDAACRSARVEALKKPLLLKADLPGAPLRISGDPDRLQQVVRNLIANSIKFTPAGGQVIVMLEREGRFAKLTVRDTGVGISAEFLPYVFERFRQASGAHSRSYGGLGLGLAITKHVVETHQGTVTAESAGQDEGTLMTVRLPLLTEIASGVEHVTKVSSAPTYLVGIGK